MKYVLTFIFSVCIMYILYLLLNHWKYRYNKSTLTDALNTRYIRSYGLGKCLYYNSTWYLVYLDTVLS